RAPRTPHCLPGAHFFTHLLTHLLIHLLTHLLTYSLTYSLTHSLALFSICLKASCARRKQQEFQALPQRLRFPERAESEEMSTLSKRELKTITNDQTLPSRNPGEFRCCDRNHLSQCVNLYQCLRRRAAHAASYGNSSLYSNGDSG